jgi:hypothetical protein
MGIVAGSMCSLGSPVKGLGLGIYLRGQSGKFKGKGWSDGNLDIFSKCLHFHGRGVWFDMFNERGVGVV